jgi:chromosomal replication initiator protein
MAGDAVPSVTRRRAVQLQRALEDARAIAIASINQRFDELQAVLTTVTTPRVPFGNALAQLVLDEITNSGGELEIRGLTVITVVADHFGLTVEELCGHGRSQGLVRARHIAMYLCRELTGLSWNGIGALFDHRDHTTVMSAHRRIVQLRAGSERAGQQVSDLTLLVRRRAVVESSRRDGVA